MLKQMRSRLPIFLVVPALVACAETGLDEGTRQRVVTLGDSAATALVETLGGRLNAHLANAGPRGAIEFCAGEAQALTDSVSGALGPGWAVKRTTTRTRNPANAPDSLEAEALLHFQQAAADQELPEHLVQVTSDGDYRYYRPLRMGDMCLQCHGPSDAIDPDVRAVLDARYPADQATGYAEGQFRGLVRVTVPGTAVD